MKRIQLLLSTILFLFALSAPAQKIFELMDKNNVNLKQVQDEAATYFARVGTGSGTGYEIFKRWEYHAITNVQEDGTVRSIKDNLAAIQKLKKSIAASGRKTTSPSNWTELGPVEVTKTSGGDPRGIGRITAIYVEPVDQKIIYAGAPGGGLWKSIDAGNSWLPLGDQFDNMFIWSIEVDPTDTNIVYIGNSLGELQKSTDGGLSFNLLLKQSGNLRDILINPEDPDEIYAAMVNDGLYHTVDSGKTWTKVIDGDVEDVVFKPGSTSIIYACGDDFYRSTNSGSSFTKVTSGIESSYRMKIAVSAAKENYVYIVQRGPSGFGYLYRSVDNGANFTIQSDASVGNFIGLQEYRDMVISVSDTNSDEVHIGGFELYKSLDGGVSFERETLGYASDILPYLHSDIEVMQYINGTIYVGCDGGIYKSSDAGASFTDLSNGLGIQQLYRIANSASNKNIVLGGAQDNGSSIRSGNPSQWTSFLEGDGMDCMVDPDNEALIYGSRQNGVLVTSRNGGANVMYLRPPENGKGVWVTPFGMDPNDSNKIYAGYTDLYRHNNGGLTEDDQISEPEDWVNVSSNIIFDSKLYHLELCPSRSDVIYVATLTSLYKSTNITSESPIWTRLAPPISDGRFINDIVIDPYDENRVAVVTTSGYIVLSTDGGTSWDKIDKGLPNTAIKSMVFDRSPDKGMYVGIDGAVFYKSNTVTDWTIFSDKLPNVVLTELELYYDKEIEENSRIRLATFGRGIWESPLYNTSKMYKNSCIDGINAAYTKIEAENFCEQFGIQIEAEGESVEYINNNDYIKFNSVAFGNYGATTFVATVSSNNSGGSIEIRLDSPTGKKVGTCLVENTGGWTEWVDVSCDISSLVGDHDIYLVFTGGPRFLFNLDSFQFTEIDICDVGINAYTTIEAEDFCEESGVQIESDGKSVGFIENLDYIKFNAVNFGDIESTNFEAVVGSASSGGTIEIHLDDPVGSPIGVCTVDNTGGWTNWVDISCEIDGITDTHNVFLVFKGRSGFLFNINSFGFKKQSLSTDSTLAKVNEEIILFPNPVRNTMRIQLPSIGQRTEVTITNVMGQIIKTQRFDSHQSLNLLEMNLKGYAQGLYTVIIETAKTKMIKTIVIEN